MWLCTCCREDVIDPTYVSGLHNLLYEFVDVAAAISMSRPTLAAVIESRGEVLALYSPPDTAATAQSALSFIPALKRAASVHCTFPPRARCCDVCGSRAATRAAPAPRV